MNKNANALPNESYLSWHLLNHFIHFQKTFSYAEQSNHVFVYVHEDRLWYINMPWPGDRYNLAMVAGSDRLLRFLDRRGEDRVRALVRPSRKRDTALRNEGWFECYRQFSGLFRGATYKVYGLEGFSREIWICPVTLTVLGHYPKYIYIKQIPFTSSRGDMKIRFN